MRTRACFVGIALVALSHALAAEGQDERTADVMLARLDAYFESYHDALGQLVAEERLVQEAGGPATAESAGGRSSGVNAIKITRDIRSDVAFVDLPGGAGWLGFRERPMSITNVAMTHLSRLRSTRLSGAKFGVML